jgi:hypothetical protein
MQHVKWEEMKRHQCQFDDMQYAKRVKCDDDDDSEPAVSRVGLVETHCISVGSVA